MGETRYDERFDLYRFGIDALALVAGVDMASKKCDRARAVVRRSLDAGLAGATLEQVTTRWQAAYRRCGEAEGVDARLPGGLKLHAAIMEHTSGARATIPYGNGTDVWVAVRAGADVRDLQATVRHALERWEDAADMRRAVQVMASSPAVLQASKNRAAVRAARARMQVEARRTAWEAAAARIACDERLMIGRR